jgi:hypothetical protein
VTGEFKEGTATVNANKDMRYNEVLRKCEAGDSVACYCSAEGRYYKVKLKERVVWDDLQVKIIDNRSILLKTGEGRYLVATDYYRIEYFNGED